MFLTIIKTQLSTIIVPLVLVLGTALSFKFRWVQLTRLRHSFRIVLTKEQIKSSRGISAFSALSAVLGGNLGTGNIAGTAVALSTGGPGALFWMWVMAIIGSVIKFTGCYISILNRVSHSQQEWLGGPMYYIGHLLQSPITAKVFSGLVIVSALTVGNFVQVNSVSLPLINHGFTNWQISLMLMVFIAFVTLDKHKRFATISTYVVPWMALAYIALCLFVILTHASKLPPLLSQILTAAFMPDSIVGGTMGYGIFESMRVGFDRGLFATDAGIGIAPMLHAEIPDQHSQQQTAFEQGLVSILAPIIVMVICMMTGLVLLVTDAWIQPNLASTEICVYAFTVGTGWKVSEYILLVTLFLFATTTLLTWSYCAERALIYLNLDKHLHTFKLLFIGFIPLGCYMGGQWIWLLADISINLMLFINLIAVFIASKPYTSQINHAIRTVGNKLNYRL
ncbi:MAG: amino acid transporter [Legionellales bacterium]|nr:amino acid transporter [Legionellales bacterium]